MSAPDPDSTPDEVLGQSLERGGGVHLRAQHDSSARGLAHRRLHGVELPVPAARARIASQAVRYSSLKILAAAFLDVPVLVVPQRISECVRCFWIRQV